MWRPKINVKMWFIHRSWEEESSLLYVGSDYYSIKMCPDYHEFLEFYLRKQLKYKIIFCVHHFRHYVECCLRHFLRNDWLIWFSIQTVIYDLCANNSCLELLTVYSCPWQSVVRYICHFWTMNTNCIVSQWNYSRCPDVRFPHSIRMLDCERRELSNSLAAGSIVWKYDKEFIIDFVSAESGKFDMNWFIPIWIEIHITDWIFNA